MLPCIQRMNSDKHLFLAQQHCRHIRNDRRFQILKSRCPDKFWCRAWIHAYQLGQASNFKNMWILTLQPRGSWCFCSILHLFCYGFLGKKKKAFIIQFKTRFCPSLGKDALMIFWSYGGRIKADLYVFGRFLDLKHCKGYSANKAMTYLFTFEHFSRGVTLAPISPQSIRKL